MDIYIYIYIYIYIHCFVATEALGQMMYACDVH